MLSALCALTGILGVASAQAGPLLPIQALSSPSSVLAANPFAPLPAPGSFKVEASNGYSLFVFGAPAHKANLPPWGFSSWASATAPSTRFPPP